MISVSGISMRFRKRACVYLVTLKSADLSCHGFEQAVRHERGTSRGFWCTARSVGAGLHQTLHEATTSAFDIRANGLKQDEEQAGWV